MRTRYIFDPTDGELKDRHGNSIGVVASITLEHRPGALEQIRDHADEREELREALWKRADRSCEMCGYNNEDALAMHHRTYERLGHEELDDVLLVCHRCHGAEHDRLAKSGSPLRRPKRGEGLGCSTSVLSSGKTEKERTNNKDGVRGNQNAAHEREAIDRCWAYWLSVSGRNQKPDLKRQRHLRNALHLMRSPGDDDWGHAEALVRRALLGLARSPFHQGQNEQRRQYMEVRYALKGIGDESDQERIEKAISWAATYAPDSVQMDEDKVQRYLGEIRYTYSLPHHPERERAKQAYRKLKEAGFTITALEGPPWVRLER